jgi:outer membrane protein
MWRRRAIRVVVVLAVALAGVATAEDAPQAPRHPWRWEVLPDQWRLELPESPAVHVGAVTRDEGTARVTLREAIALALENNPQSAAQRLEPLRQSEGILGAQATYDPMLSGELTSAHSTTPAASALQGSNVLNTDQRDANFHLFKTFRPGTQATIDFLNDRLDSNSRFTSLRPQYKPQLNLSIVQPLLRGLGWDFSYLLVKEAEEVADQARYQYEANLSDFVRQVIEDYWAVVGAREQVDVQKQSKALADRTVE